MIHSVQKRIVAPTIIDLRAELDVPASIYFIGHKSPTRIHQVWPIGLNKP